MCRSVGQCAGASVYNWKSINTRSQSCFQSIILNIHLAVFWEISPSHRKKKKKKLLLCSSKAFKDENSWLTCNINSLEDNIQKVIKLGKKIWNNFTNKVQCLDTEQNASLFPVKVSLSSLGFHNILKSSLATQCPMMAQTTSSLATFFQQLRWNNQYRMFKDLKDFIDLNVLE